MKRLRFATLSALTVALFGTTASADGPVPLTEILVGFAAKESCSCAFVVEQADEYCREFGKLGGLNVDSTIDRAARTVTSSFQGATRIARVDASGGCVLDGK